jgi:hypothetical protein
MITIITIIITIITIIITTIISIISIITIITIITIQVPERVGRPIELDPLPNFPTYSDTFAGAFFGITRTHHCFYQYHNITSISLQYHY